MRMFVITDDTTADALSAQLLNANLSAAQAEAALESLQTLNPHADFNNLVAGTVLFVPDSPAFNAGVSNEIGADAIQVLDRIAKSGLDAAAARSKDATAATVAAGADITKTLKSAAFKRIVATDPDLAHEVDSAAAAIKQQKDAATSNDALVANAVDAALDTLRAMMNA